MKDETDLVSPETLLIVELDERYEFSAAPVVNDSCYNTGDCSDSTNNLCVNDGVCFA